MNQKFSMIGAVFTAFLSTLCCLPAFIFLFLGLSSGYLTFLTSLDFLRIPLAIFSIFLLALGIYKNKDCKNSCNINDMQMGKLFLALLSFVIIFLLFYPEILPYFMD